MSTKAPKYYDTHCPTCGHKTRRVDGRWLRQVRETAALTQREFGARFDVSSPYISDIERNRRDCRPDILQGYLDLR